MPENRSEVAQLLAQMRTEFEAAQRGLSGLSQGTSQHVFITARMENMGKLHEQLQEVVGESAIMLVANMLDQAVSPHSTNGAKSNDPIV